MMHVLFYSDGLHITDNAPSCYLRMEIQQHALTATLALCDPGHSAL